jgi:phenylacetic acid degradation operon negative regulatory protein
MSPTRNTLSARSVLASVLLGTEPPWLPTALLVRTGALFGITEGTVRTALSRMAAAGEAVAERGGYRLAGRLVERQERQRASRRAEVGAWDGTWELASIAADEARPAADRAALREALRALRLAELREGLWARPDNLDPQRTPAARAVADEWCTRWTGAEPSPPPDAAAVWHLTAWVERATELEREMDALAGPLERRDVAALADGFVTSAAVLRHLQADPLLPPELLPPAWPGPDLRAGYDRFDAAYRSTLRDWFSAAS